MRASFSDPSSLDAYSIRVSASQLLSVLHIHLATVKNITVSAKKVTAKNHQPILEGSARPQRFDSELPDFSSVKQNFLASKFIKT